MRLFNVIDRGEIKIVGIKGSFKIENGSVEIPKLWKNFFDRINEIKNFADDRCYGVATKIGEDFYEEIVGREVKSLEEVPAGMETIILKPNKYLVFTHTGKLVKPNGESLVKETYDNLYSKIIPNSGFMLADNFNFECYDYRFKHDDDFSMFDIYVPIK
ncbi:MAG: GyrI-like domain-containing protein [Fusobacteriaceae bacterium]